MDPIDNLTKLIETLRRQQSSAPDRLKSSGSKTRSSRPNAGGPAGKLGLEQLQRRIAERVRGLDPHNDEHRHKAARIFLEAVLTWEFGEELIQDARFTEMIQEVESQMRSDPGLSAKLDTLFRQMMNGG